VFTFVRNRTDMCYSNHAYMRRRIQAGKAPSGWSAQSLARFNRPIEAHIDEILATSSPKRELPFSLDVYHFVGVTEWMEESLLRLSERIGAALGANPDRNAVPTEKVYRRGELDVCFAPEHRIYALACARLSSDLDRGAT
jgi:hypothetical protein